MVSFEKTLHAARASMDAELPQAFEFPADLSFCLWKASRKQIHEAKEVYRKADNHILHYIDAGHEPFKLATRQGISVGTFYAWKTRSSGMNVSKTQRLRGLKSNMRRLEIVTADLPLDVPILHPIVEKETARSKRAAWRITTPKRT